MKIGRLEINAKLTHKLKLTKKDFSELIATNEMKISVIEDALNWKAQSRTPMTEKIIYNTNSINEVAEELVLTNARIKALEQVTRTFAEVLDKMTQDGNKKVSK